jgi:hypothetical protein
VAEDCTPAAKSIQQDKWLPTFRVVTGASLRNRRFATALTSFLDNDVVNFSHPLRKERGSIEVGGRFPAFIGGTDCDSAAGEVSP